MFFFLSKHASYVNEMVFEIREKKSYEKRRRVYEKISERNIRWNGAVQGFYVFASDATIVITFVIIFAQIRLIERLQGDRRKAVRRVSC